MAQHDDALPLSAVLAGETGEGIEDLLRGVVRDALQELIEEELTATSVADSAAWSSSLERRWRWVLGSRGG